MRHILGIEIGGSKLQLALGRDDTSQFVGFWRSAVDASHGADPIRERIVSGVCELLAQAGVSRDEIAGVGIGFGGPVDVVAGMTIVSNQVAGWENFPLVAWVREQLGWPAVIQNDADTAALAEATFGAGRGFDPLLYLTVGSGIGGGLICDGSIFRGNGQGAVEVGHLRPRLGELRTERDSEHPSHTVESWSSGFGIEQRTRQRMAANIDPPGTFDRLRALTNSDPDRLTTRLIAQAAAAGDPVSQAILNEAVDVLGWAIGQAMTLINPARVVVGGGVSLIGEEQFFTPLRNAVRRWMFPPFVGQADVVPAALGEEVVVHGALALAKAAFGG
ncbi:MAG: ROK family protein [Planctomycetales bacterium]|nr:ROK family protein [Planctomycetales bacterium]